MSKFEAGDTEALIAIGAGIEAQLELCNQHSDIVGEALMQCLAVLQFIFQENPEEIGVLMDSLGNLLVAIEHNLGTPPNPMTDAMLRNALEGVRKMVAGNTAEPPEEPQEPFGDDSEPIVESEATTEQFNEPAPSAPASLEEAAAMLMQIEEGDKASLEALFEGLKSIGEKEDSGERKKLVVKAARETKKAIDGKSGDLDETLSKVGRIFDEILHLADEAATLEEPVLETAPEVEFEDSTIFENEIDLADEEQLPDEVAGDEVEVDLDPDALGADSDKALVTEFITESRELLEAAESALLELEADPGNIEGVNTVFRAFHTIKGSAAFLDLKRTTEFAHFAESLLSRMRDKEIICAGGYADLALISCDILRQLLTEVENGLGGSAMKLPLAYKAVFEVLKSPEAAGVNDKERFSIANQAADDEGAADGNAKSGTDSGGESTVRVRTDRLDSLIDIVGELVIAQSMIFQDDIVLNGAHPDLNKKVSHAGKIVRELQNLSMAMRMIPLRGTFQKMARIVRDVSRKCGKEVDFVTDGEETEIDRNMVDFVANPLIHMVRNAADHGIEMPEDRKLAGKNPIGNVRLAAYHSGGDVVIELEDDGAGLDKDKLVAKAIANGIIESDQGMSENEIYQLIFAPGFSTAQEVTDVSGRGVGMDVVRKNIEIMRGRIEITSEKGFGTKFTIRLPLTLAITDGMLVRVGEEKFILPTINIQLSFQPSKEMLSSVAGKGEMVSLRGELMPVFRLHKLFCVDGAVEEMTDGLLIIIADGRRRCALLVDELLGQQQVVAKTLGNSIGKVQGVSGGAILGDGCVGLILDTSEIVAMARQYASSHDRKKPGSEIKAA
ncbi:MAG: chemotaxis protein CheW [Pyrinomonadaceae bacterium]